VEQAVDVLMPAEPEERGERPERSRRPRGLIETFYSPNSYGLMLLLILLTYGISVTLTEGRIVSVVVAVQIDDGLGDPSGV
jgi:hypothetical protein